MNNENSRCGFVAVIGPPNAGKSTLANQLTGQKVAIVTHKAQTTRMRLRAIFQEATSQIIVVDTPGVFKPNQRLDKSMVREAWAGANDADAVIVLLDASQKFGEDGELVFAGAQKFTKPVFLVLNKIDRVERSRLLEIVDRLSKVMEFKEVFLISALNGDGTQRLKQVLAETVPQGPFLYPADQAADIPSQLLAAEVTREKLFMRLHQELPYTLTVETEKWERKRDGSVRIEQTIFVRRDGQKAIVLGKNGKAIREVGEASRRDIEEMFGHRVHLFLFVKVRANWMEDPARYRALGLEFKVD